LWLHHSEIGQGIVQAFIIQAAKLIPCIRHHHLVHEDKQLACARLLPAPHWSEGKLFEPGT
jgi:hypothetical protein